MIRTVRTSYTLFGSSEGFDDLANEGEGDRFNESPIRFDEDSSMMSRECRHDVLMLELPADEVFGSVELDPPMAVHLADERHAPLGDGDGQMPMSVAIGIQSEALGQVAKLRPEPITKHPGILSFVFGQSKTPAGLLKMVIVEEAPTALPQGLQITAAMPEHTLLPEAVEALHGSVSAWLARRDEGEVDVQEEMKPDDLREAVAIAPAAGSSHFIIQLGDARDPHNLPAINEMPAERARSLVEELGGRDGLPGHIDAVVGVKASEAPGSPEITGADQVGLVKISHFSGQGVGISWTFSFSASSFR